MFKKSLAFAAALSLAAAPAVAAPVAPAVGTSSAGALSLQSTTGSDEGSGLGGPFAAPGAGIGIALFSIVIVLGILLGTGTLFGDDDDRPFSA